MRTLVRSYKQVMSHSVIIY